MAELDQISGMGKPGSFPFDPHRHMLRSSDAYTDALNVGRGDRCSMKRQMQERLRALVARMRAG